KRPASGQWGIFLRNHDELDLGRLTKKQRQRVFDAFGPNPEDQLYKPWNPAAAGADAERGPAAARACLQPDVHAARHPRPSVWRRARHGRRPLAARTGMLPDADAVVDRAEWRLH